MQATVLCDLSAPNKGSLVSHPSFKLKINACAAELRQARSRGHLVSHIITKWPGYRRLLTKCTAQAHEPVFLATDGAVKNFCSFVDYLLCFPVQQINLIGVANSDFELELVKQFSGFDTILQNHLSTIPEITGIPPDLSKSKTLDHRGVP